MELEDVLSDKEPAPKEVEAPPQEKPAVDPGLRARHQQKEAEAVEQGRPRDPESGKFVPKAKEEAPKVDAPKVEAKPEVKPPPQEMTEKERAFLKTAEEERRKRQELERELAQYRQQKQPANPAEEKKTFWDDPEGHFKTVEQRLAQKELAITMRVSEQLARSKYQDFDEKIAVFAEDLQKTPGLHAQWLAAPDPAEFAYKHGQRTKEMREFGNIEDYKKKIEQETRARLEAEFKAKQEELEKKRAELPGSLSDVRGTTTQQRPVYTGPTPLDDILGRRS